MIPTTGSKTYHLIRTSSWPLHLIYLLGTLLETTQGMMNSQYTNMVSPTSLF